MLFIFFKRFLIVSCLILRCRAQDDSEETSEEENQILRSNINDVSTVPPYHVSLINLDINNFLIYFLCSGALISTKHVLTSAKCMGRVPEDDITIAVVGKTTFDPNNGDTFYSTGSLIQCYTGFVNDIAILSLTTAVDIVYGKRETVQLPTSQTKFCCGKLKGLQQSGSGIDFGTNISMEISIQNNVKVTKHEPVRRIRCYSWIRKRFGNSQGSLMCTKPMNYQNCIGDLGSPLVKPSSDGYGNELLGLAVYDMKACRTIPIIYTYIPTYVSWINWVIYNDLSK